MNNLLSRQDGLAMIMVIGFMGIAVPLITAALSLSGTPSIDSALKTRILKNQYSALGANQYAEYIVGQDLPPGNYNISLNGSQVNVNLQDVPPPAAPQPPADNSRRLMTTKTVTPTTATTGTLTTFTYTITVNNGDDEAENLTKIHDILPSGFTYINNSTNGITSDDPSIAGQQLTWSPATIVNPGDSIALTFDAQASLAEGNYCNEAWVEPGNEKTSSGLTAKIKAGAPADDLCPGKAVTVTKTVTLDEGIIMENAPMTFHYSIKVENTGTDDLEIHDVKDLLPVGFLYVPNTISGDIAGASFNTTTFQGRERLTWDYDPADFDLVSGNSMTLNFDAIGVFVAGHWNEAWINIHDMADTVYTWPTAGVYVTDAVETTTTTPDGTTVYSLMRQVGPETFIMYAWEISS